MSNPSGSGFRGGAFPMNGAVVWSRPAEAFAAGYGELRRSRWQRLRQARSAGAKGLAWRSPRSVFGAGSRTQDHDIQRPPPCSRISKRWSNRRHVVIRIAIAVDLQERAPPGAKRSKRRAMR